MVVAEVSIRRWLVPPLSSLGIGKNGWFHIPMSPLCLRRPPPLHSMYDRHRALTWPENSIPSICFAGFAYATGSRLTGGPHWHRPAAVDTDSVAYTVAFLYMTRSIDRWSFPSYFCLLCFVLGVSAPSFNLFVLNVSSHRVPDFSATTGTRFFQRSMFVHNGRRAFTAMPFFWYLLLLLLSISYFRKRKKKSCQFFFAGAFIHSFSCLLTLYISNF